MSLISILPKMVNLIIKITEHIDKLLGKKDLHQNWIKMRNKRNLSFPAILSVM